MGSIGCERALSILLVQMALGVSKIMRRESLNQKSWIALVGPNPKVLSEGNPLAAGPRIIKL